MAERIKLYLKYVDEMLEKPEGEVDIPALEKEHLTQIAFFAHERMIHLIVTVLFAIMTMVVFLYTLSNPQLALFLLLLFLLILLVPYIKHYYLLENSVQRMYDQYDSMVKKHKKDAFIDTSKHGE